MLIKSLILEFNNLAFEQGKGKGATIIVIIITTT